MRKIIAGVLALGLSGCVTAQEMADAEQVRFRSFNGMTIAQFISATGLTPHGAQNIDGGRVFNVTSHSGWCSMLVFASATGTKDEANSWTITKIIRRGGCQNI